jgi:hypothetical protein
MRHAQFAQLQDDADNDDNDDNVDEDQSSDAAKESNANSDTEQNDNDKVQPAAMDSNPDAVPVEAEVPETPAGFFEAVAQTITNLSQVRSACARRLMWLTCSKQLFLLLGVFDNNVLWKKSVLNARCRVCRKASNEDKMLLCDSCEGMFAYIHGLCPVFKHALSCPISFIRSSHVCSLTFVFVQMAITCFVSSPRSAKCQTTIGSARYVNPHPARWQSDVRLLERLSLRAALMRKGPTRRMTKNLSMLAAASEPSETWYDVVSTPAS